MAPPPLWHHSRSPKSKTTKESTHGLPSATHMKRTRYETPDAVAHDFRSLIDDARSLIIATSESTDEKVTEARRRLEHALSNGREKLDDLRERADESLDAADACVRRHPYESLAVALGLGAVFGYLITRRD